jgi:hypothetical protein
LRLFDTDHSNWGLRMPTLVKLVRDFGLDGRLVHQHGDSYWHPAHRKHTGRVNGRGYASNSHTANDAANPLNAVSVLTTDALRQAYSDCLESIEQPEFAAKWEEYKAKRRGA